MKLNDHGRIVDECWRLVPVHFAKVELDAFVIMPNHMHGIIQIIDPERRGEVLSPRHEANTPDYQIIPPRHEANAPRDESQWQQFIQNPGGGTPPQRKPTLGQIVAYFKYRSTKEMNLLDDLSAIAKFWQRNYFESIIRDDRELTRVRNYIDANPANWQNDEENR